MSTPATKLGRGLLTLALVGVGAAICAAEPAGNAAGTGVTSTGSAAAPEGLQRFSEGSQELYQRVARALIHVKVEENAEGLLPAGFRKEFEEFRDRVGKEGPATMPFIRQRLDERRRGRDANATQTATRPARGGPAMQPAAFLIGRFLEEKARNTQDPEALTKIRNALISLEGLRTGQSGDAVGVVISPDGDAIVLVALGDPAKKAPLQVTLAEGKESTATLVGANYLRGYSLLKLAAHPSTFVPLTDGRPTQGELLLNISSKGGAVAWIAAGAPLPTKGRHGPEERFAVPTGDERSGSYLFNIRGELVAIGLAHHVAPAEVFKRELDLLRRFGGMPSRNLGVRYAAVPPESPLRQTFKALGLRPALRVEEVLANTPAAKAGLQQGDFVVKIDGQPVGREALQRILSDMLTRTTPVQFEIVRGDDTIPLEIPMPKPSADKPAN